MKLARADVLALIGITIGVVAYVLDVAVAARLL